MRWPRHYAHRPVQATEALALWQDFTILLCTAAIQGRPARATQSELQVILGLILLREAVLDFSGEEMLAAL